MLGEKAEEVVSAMNGKEAKDRQYIRLICSLAALLNRQQENKIKGQPGYARGYRAAIEDMATDFFDPPNRQKAEAMVSADLTRMRAALKADSDKRKAEIEEG